jgi:hypothetical protein
MGTRNGPYEADFPVGTRVRIKSRDFLKQFKDDWKFHNPLRILQLFWGGTVGTVSSVGYYHGGDELYHLRFVPGVWHEVCLEMIEDQG